MKHTNLIITLMSFLSILTACNSQANNLPASTDTLFSTQPSLQSTNDISANGCILPLETFAYKTRTDKTGTRPGVDLIVPPAPPWFRKEQIPLPKDKEVLPSYTQNLSVARNTKGHNEIWIQNLFGSYPAYVYSYTIYYPNIQEWRNISGEVGDHTGVYVARLFVGKDGSIWGQNSWDDLIKTHPRPSSLTAFPLLSKYNEETEKFEFVEGSQGIPAGWYSENLGTVIDKVLLALDGTFWFLVSKDAIYSYDPVTDGYKRHTEISDYHVQYDSIAPDGKIYFIVITPPSQKGLFYFDPSTDEVKPVDLTYSTYDTYLPNVFVDRIGQLWLGGLGWRDTDENTWHRLHPSPIFIAAAPEGSTTYWQTPFLFIESSDNRLWFSSANGLAWLDLEQEQWCWFTTYQSNIVEDSDHNLWMIADGKLYKNPLGK